MANDLIQPEDLADFPGAPFAESVVDAAVDRVRSEAGWHIAPERTETVTLNGTSMRELVLPTLKVGTVTEVRDVTDPDNPVVLTGWTVLRGGMLFRAYGWPCWFGTQLEVDLTHGYDTTPAALFGLVAAAAREATTDATVRREKDGPFEVERADASDAADALRASWAALDPYRARTGF